MDIPPEEIEICLKVLQQISEDTSLIDDRDRFKSLIAKIYKKGSKNSRRAARETRQLQDRNLKEKTGIVQTQCQEKNIAALPYYSTFLPNNLNQPISCYICKQSYIKVHFFYHLLCPKCAEFNYQKRHQTTNLTDRVALITGGRIKIGYQTALRMLRDEAKVIVTTRFSRDCARRFSEEKDFKQWRDRLQIHQLDLRNIPAVEAFVCHLLEKELFLDIIINNAAQTIKRTTEFYQHLLEGEIEDDRQNILPKSDDRNAIVNPYFPANMFDRDGQQIDLRPINSWLLKLGEVSTLEMLEVQLVNAIAPFILNSKLKPLLLRSKFDRRFIINVSAMEGQFNRDSKTVFHPHTNMAKAALNMMTRTSAADYANDGIFMNSVDTGWITDENPYSKKNRLQETFGFYTPLDAIDGMARIYDPIVQGIENRAIPQHGYFLKDYVPYPW